MPGGNKGHTYLNKTAAKKGQAYLSMCGLLLPPGIKRLSTGNVFYGTDNFNQKGFLKTIFE